MIRPRSLCTLMVSCVAVASVAVGCGSSGSGTAGNAGHGGSQSLGQAGVGQSTGPAGNSGGGDLGTAGTGDTTGASGSGGDVSGTAGSGAAGDSGAGTGGASAGTAGTGAGTAGSGAQGTAGRTGTGGSGTGGKGAGGSSAMAGTAGANGTGTGGSGGTGASMTPGMSAGCGKMPTIDSSMYNNGKPISIMSGTMQRRYILHVPTGYDNTKPYKLVVAYHALNSNDHSVYTENYYGMLPLSNNTTIFVAPNGQKSGAPCMGTGTGESGCGWPNTGDQDMQFADAVVKQVEDNFCVDTNRIFATGWSYGASMSEQTACERPLGGTGAWGVRAIAVYAVAYLSNATNCKPSKPVAYYATHGTCDSVLTYDGQSRCSTTTGEQGGVGIAKTWSGVDGCTWKLPTKVTSGAHVCETLDGCMSGYPVEFCSFHGDHTAYPDNGQEQGSWGPAEAWKFFSQF